MKSAVSWSIEGVAPEARETAREAARRAGLSVGEWINAAIIDSAPVAGAQSSTAEPRNDESPRRLAEAIGRLSERLETLIEGRPAETEGRGNALDRALMASDGGREQEPGAPDEWSFGLDQAVAEISGRQRMLDDGVSEVAHPVGTRSAVAGMEIPLQNVSGLEDHLRHITAQIETLRRPCPFDGEVAALRRDLGDIKRTLGEAMPRCAVEVLEDQIRSLSTRVDRGREGADGVALAGVELRLARVCDALNRLAPAENVAGLDEEVAALSRKIDVVASQGTDPATMQQLETAIAELRRVSERVASGDALTKLATEVRTLADKIDRFDTAVSGMDAVSALERRMEALGGTLTEYAANVGRSAGPNIEALMHNVSERLERLQAVRADQAALGHLEEQIAKLTEKLDASDNRMAHLGDIERTLADMFLQIEDTRAGAIEAAERAAKVAARELTVAEAGEQVAVEILQRDLMDLRESQADNDRRTQQTLESVHDAVQRMVNRMAGMDFSRPADVRPGAAPVEAMVAPPPSRAVAVADRPSLPLARTAPMATPSQPPQSQHAAARAPASERRPIDPTLPADTPLEPGSGAPRGRLGATPAERIAASEAALGPSKSGATPERGEKANFIAAARRAAQAAAADAAATDPHADETSEARTGGIAQVLGKHKRPLLMAAGAIVVLAGTLQLATGMLGSGTPRGEAARAVPKEAAGQRDLLAMLAPDAIVQANPAAIAETPTSLAAAPSLPPARTPGDAAANGAAMPGLPPGLASVNLTGDVTGTLAKPQNNATLTPPPAALLAPPTIAPPDTGKLPASIGSANLRAAIATGDPAAAYEVAVRFAEGRGVPLSMEEAARWFRRAADHGLAPAQYRLGSLLEKGQGVKRDLEAARRLYTAASEKGNAKAMHNLAVLYAEGIDGKPDYATAVQWFRKAAARGVADSQYNLGILHARGIGAEQNFAEAYKWFALAAAQGDQDAGRKQEDVAKRLDATSLAAARLAAQTFMPEAQPEDATIVKAPPGGWDRAASSAAPAKPKPAANRKTGST